MKKGVIWDLDGTLVNSIPVHFRRHKKLFAQEFNIHLTRAYYEERCDGSQENEFYHTILQDFLGNEKPLQKAIKKSHLSKYQADLSKIKTFSYVKTVLKKLRKDGYSMVVASSSHISYVKTILKHNNLLDYFDAIISSSEVKHAKPNPEIFLHAQKKLHLTKKDCLIIEDTKAGVIAAKRAGIHCLCLLTSEKRKDIPSWATIVSTHKQLYPAIKRFFR